MAKISEPRPDEHVTDKDKIRKVESRRMIGNRIMYVDLLIHKKMSTIPM